MTLRELEHILQRNLRLRWDREIRRWVGWIPGTEIRGRGALLKTQHSSGSTRRQSREDYAQLIRGRTLVIDISVPGLPALPRQSYPIPETLTA